MTASPPGPVGVIAICVVTYHRPIWLGELLKSVVRLAPPAGVDAPPVVVVVDNDADGSAREVVERASARSPFRFIYETEPRRGISFARNRAVALALGAGAEFIAFVDDDEIVRPDWLRELLQVQRAYAADVVSGPVVPRFDDGIPSWVIRGGFFERQRFGTGDVRRGGATNNCLISRRLFADSPEPFDPSFAAGGGSDAHFFKQVARGGGRIVWADGAVVEEWVPRSRARVRWLLQRAYRGGNAFALSERILDRSGRWFWVGITKGLARALQGALMLVPSMLLGRAPAVRALQKSALGAGRLAGVLGFRYEEYRDVHGR